MFFILFFCVYTVLIIMKSVWVWTLEMFFGVKFMQHCLKLRAETVSWLDWSFQIINPHKKTDLNWKAKCCLLVYFVSAVWSMAFWWVIILTFHGLFLIWLTTLLQMLMLQTGQIASFGALKFVSGLCWTSHKFVSSLAYGECLKRDIIQSKVFNWNQLLNDWIYLWLKKIQLNMDWALISLALFWKIVQVPSETLEELWSTWYGDGNI